MNWVKRNQNTTLLFAIVIIGMIILFVSNRDITSYAKIEIEQGDTLWSLSDKYKGNLTNDEWVRLVKNENNMIDDKIIAGHTLSIPEYNKTISNDKGIEVASEDNGK